MTSRLRGGLCVLVSCFAARSALGQVVRGATSDEAGRAVAGVVVMLLDSTGKAVARAVTNERGEFAAIAPRGGTYRTRTLRVGFRPTVSERFVVGDGSTVRTISLSSIRVALDTVRVVDRAACRLDVDSAAATFSVWDQARTALTATELTAIGRGVEASTIAYDRVLERDFTHVRSENAAAHVGYVRQAWRAAAPSLLHRTGYVTRDSDGTTTFWAPGLDMLTSDTFIEDHCFHLQTVANPALIGLAFEPSPTRRNLSEISGLLLLDRKTAELRSLTFGYTNLSRDETDYAGGRMEFARMRDGSWVISRWFIRMPVLAEGPGVSRRIEEIREVGGSVATLRRGADTLWRRSPVTLSGTVVDSATDQPLSDASVVLRGTGRTVTVSDGKFSIPDMLPGEYFLDVHTPGLDSIGAVREQSVTITDSLTPVRIRVKAAAQMLDGICKTSSGRARGGGVVLGIVRQRSDTAAPRPARVRAEWYTIALRDERGVVSEHQKHTLETTAGANGVFRLCGIPLDADVAIDARAERLASEPQTLHLTGRRFARMTLVLDPGAEGIASVVGTVSDSARNPIAGAEVAIASARRSVTTDAKGFFRLDSLALGSYDLAVRRLPYAPIDIHVELTTPGRVSQEVILSRAVALDPVVRTENRLPQSFADNQRIGLGHFMTRGQLAAEEGRKLSSVMAQLPGLGLTYGSSGEAWVKGSHGHAKLYTPTRAERAHGMIASCYAQVYVDGVLENRGDPTPAFDLNSLSPDRIEALEFYASPAETPAIYSGLNSGCGVLVIWLRRSN